MAPTIPILNVVFEPSTGQYLYRVPNLADTITHYRTKYDSVGQHLSELGGMVQRQQFPHFMNTAGWMHIIPRDDIIAHKYGAAEFECQCAPQVDCLNRVVCHHALDGRGEYGINDPSWEVVDAKP